MACSRSILCGRTKGERRTWGVATRQCAPSIHQERSPIQRMTTTSHTICSCIYLAGCQIPPHGGALAGGDAARAAWAAPCSHTRAPACAGLVGSMALPHLPSHAPQKQPATADSAVACPQRAHSRQPAAGMLAATTRVRFQRCQSAPDPETGLHHFQQVALSVALEPLQQEHGMTPLPGSKGMRHCMRAVAGQQRHAALKRARSGLHAADAQTYTHRECPAAHQVPSMQQVAQLAAAKVHAHCSRTTAPEEPLTRLTRGRWDIEKQRSTHAHCSTGQSRCQVGRTYRRQAQRVARS